MTTPGGAGQEVRRFFQYLLLLGLLVAAASGVAGLLGRLLGPLLDPDPVLVADDADLALQLTFTLIALPLWGLLAWWTSRRLRTDPQEPRSLGWAAYLTLAGLVSLLVAAVAWQVTLRALVDDGRDGQLATALVWTAVWAAHLRWGRAVTPAGQLRTELLLGSLVGLVLAAVGLVLTLAPSLRELLGLGGRAILGSTVEEILGGAATLVVGAAVWCAYWALRAARGPRDTAWLALVLLAGVAGGLLTAVVTASLLGWDTLVWLVGDPGTADAAEHFGSAPVQLAALLVGLLVWWYHSALLAEGSGSRTELRRVYEYLLAAVGLLAAAGGLVMVLVTLVEAIAAGDDLVVGGSAVNALLAALVLLAVGTPVWWWHWRQAQAARRADAPPELASATRRTYLLVLFGVAGVVAVVALISLVFLVLEDALSGGVDAETIRRLRFPLGLLATTSVLSAYHWTVFRGDREAAAGADPAPVPGRAGGLRQVLLLGAAAPGLGAEVASRTGLDVRVMRRTDVEPVAWSVEEVVALLADVRTSAVVVVAETDGLRVLPVEADVPYAA